MSDTFTVGSNKIEVDTGITDTLLRIYNVRDPDHLWSPVVHAILDDSKRERLIHALGGVVPEETATAKNDVFMENASFNDIRKGDRVRRERNSGSTCMIAEGIAGFIGLDSSAWFTTDEAGRAEYILTDVDHPDDIITILSRPTPSYTNGTVVFDDDGRTWFNKNGMWHCIDIPNEVPRTTKKLIELYGEPRPAKVVLDDA